ncbi:MAG: hypothetical protein U5J62_09085 [Desulfurivibrio sp.]|nr:hypothetical protein [Desulfurivibrio sp.]
MTSSTTATPPPAGKRKMFNFLFIGVCLLILLFLWFAPPETTPRVPQDEEHLSFFTMERKAAENYCDNCHHPDGSQPLSEEHPTTFRCLFCHKRDPLPANPEEPASQP